MIKSLPTIKSINVGEDGVPVTVTVKMTVTQLAEVAKILGRLSPSTGATDETSALYNCALSELFNRYWKDGINDYESGKGVM